MWMLGVVRQAEVSHIYLFAILHLKTLSVQVIKLSPLLFHFIYLHSLPSAEWPIRWGWISSLPNRVFATVHFTQTAIATNLNKHQGLHIATRTLNGWFNLLDRQSSTDHRWFHLNSCGCAAIERESGCAAEMAKAKYESEKLNIADLSINRGKFGVYICTHLHRQPHRWMRSKR